MKRLLQTTGAGRPVPTVLWGLLAALSMAAGTARADNPASDAASGAADTADRAASSATDTARDTADRSTDAARDTADTARDTADRSTDAARDTTDRAASSANDSARDAADRSSDRARDAAERSSTRQEGRRTARDARDSARDTSQDVRRSGRDAADRTRDDARDAARDVRREGRDTARDVRGSTRSTARDSRIEAGADRRTNRADVRTRSSRNSYGLTFSTDRDRLTVGELTDRSVASRAGIRRGDVIVSINGRRVHSHDDYDRWVATRPRGRVPVIIIRDGTERTVYLEQMVEAESAGGGYLGVQLDTTRQGEALVTGTNPGGPAEQAGLQRGDIILAVDDQAIRSPNDLSATVSSMSPGTEVEVLFDRDNREQRAMVTLGSRGDRGRVEVGYGDREIVRERDTVPGSAPAPPAVDVEVDQATVGGADVRVDTERTRVRGERGGIRGRRGR